MSSKVHVRIVTMSATYFKSLQFIWKIANYSQEKLRNGPGKRISSQDFPADCEGDLKFILYFYPEGRAQFGDTEISDNKKWASLFLDTRSNKKYDTSHHVEFSILDADGEKFCSYCFHKKNPIDYGCLKFIRLSRLENPANNLLPSDTLTIFCRVEDTQSKTEGDCNCLIEEPETTQTRLVRDFAPLLDDKFADFVFKVENEKIAAHRAVLAARSPVFDAMFQHDMLENRTNETEITDVTPAAFRALLRFIYTGQCEVGVLAEEILVAANKYDIQELKEICAKKLHKKLTADNAVDLLIFSDVHQAEDLKIGAIRFINKNAPAVMKTPSWSTCPKFQLRKKLTVDNAVDLLIFSDLHQANDLKEAAIHFINKNAPAVIRTSSWPAFVRNHNNLLLELYSKLLE